MNKIPYSFHPVKLLDNDIQNFARNVNFLDYGFAFRLFGEVFVIVHGFEGFFFRRLSG